MFFLSWFFVLLAEKAEKDIEQWQAVRRGDRRARGLRYVLSDSGLSTDKLTIEANESRALGWEAPEIIIRGSLKVERMIEAARKLALGKRSAIVVPLGVLPCEESAEEREARERRENRAKRAGTFLAPLAIDQKREANRRFQEALASRECGTVPEARPVVALLPWSEVAEAGSKERIAKERQRAARRQSAMYRDTRLATGLVIVLPCADSLASECRARRLARLHDRVTIRATAPCEGPRFSRVNPYAPPARIEGAHPPFTE